MTDLTEFKEENEESLTKTQDTLFKAFGDTIQKECEGRALTVIMPVLDALGIQAINTIMMAPPEDRERFFITFVIRMKSWYQEATAKADDAKRVITLN
jgi:hypothetical protein